MKAGFTVEHHGNINALEGIIVSNYPSTNTVANYGFINIEIGLDCKGLNDIGVWRNKKRRYDCETTKFEFIQVVRPDGYPKVKELKARKQFKSDPKDPNYDQPYSKLEKIYAD